MNSGMEALLEKSITSLTAYLICGEFENSYQALPVDGSKDVKENKMSDEEMRGNVIPRILKDTDTIYFSSAYEAKTSYEENTNVFLFPVQQTDEEKEEREQHEEPEIYQELDYYFEHLNDGRPFFIACAADSIELMKEQVISGYMRDRHEYFGRMIAAYAPGYSENTEESGWKLFHRKPHKISESSDDLGVIVTTEPENLREDIDTRHKAWQNKGKIHVPEAVKMLPRLIIKPATCGPEFVKKRHVAASFLAIGMHALGAAFFAVSLFHSLNTALLNLMLDLGDKVSEGLYSLSGTIHDFLEKSLISLISMIPGIGEALGSSLDNAAGESLDHAARYFSLEVGNFLNKLYDVLELPEGLGFGLGFAASFVASLIMVILIKMLLKITSHPMRKKGENLALAGIRSMIAIPFVVISAIAAMFSPLIGILLYNLVFIFGVVYIFTVIIRSGDTKSADRLSFLYPFFVIFALGVMALSFGIVIGGTIATIYSKATAFISTLGI